MKSDSPIAILIHPALIREISMDLSSGTRMEFLGWKSFEFKKKFVVNLTNYYGSRNRLVFYVCGGGAR